MLKKFQLKLLENLILYSPDDIKVNYIDCDNNIIDNFIQFGEDILPKLYAVEQDNGKLIIYDEYNVINQLLTYSTKDINLSLARKIMQSYIMIFIVNETHKKTIKQLTKIINK